jgi:predicted alpha/beta-hydrolase family hydrolase
MDATWAGDGIGSSATPRASRGIRERRSNQLSYTRVGVPNWTRAATITSVSVIEIDTPRGPGRLHLHEVKRPRGALVLGHGAGGGVEAPDLVAARKAAEAEAFNVALVEQPYRVAGRRSPPPAAHLDEAWIAIVHALRKNELKGLPLIVGGRSMGGRVACRSVAATRAVAVLCLAFPLEPPGRKKPQNRLPELEAVTVPVLVVQGERDPFGIPPPGPSREVVKVPGDHGLKADPEAVTVAVRAWLAGRNL